MTTDDSCRRLLFPSLPTLEARLFLQPYAWHQLHYQGLDATQKELHY
jgi:hypothetical protein